MGYIKIISMTNLYSSEGQPPLPPPPPLPSQPTTAVNKLPKGGLIVTLLGLAIIFLSAVAYLVLHNPTAGIVHRHRTNVYWFHHNGFGRGSAQF